jgi:AraC-like DNA-binding protein
MVRDIIVLTPVYVSFFWALTFLLNRFSANRARYWLGIFMAVVAVLYTCHALFFYKMKTAYLAVDFLYLITGLLVYPMYYVYIRLLTRDLHLKRSYLLHFIPAMVLGIAMWLAHRYATPVERGLYYDNVLINNRWVNHGVTSGFVALTSIFYLSRILFGIQALGYLITGIHLVKKYNRRIVNFYSNTEGRELKWVHLLTASFLITSALSSVANLMGRGKFLDNNIMLLFPSLLFSSLFFMIGYLGNRQDFTIRSFDDDEKEEDEEWINLSGHQDRNLKIKLISLMENKKRFLDPELKITDLCSDLNTNRTYISNVINKDFGVNFNDLVNGYRVEYAKDLIKNNRDEEFSLQSIAVESGFGSLSSFTRAFKKNTGTTVAVFKSQLANVPSGSSSYHKPGMQDGTNYPASRA